MGIMSLSEFKWTPVRQLGLFVFLVLIASVDAFAQSAGNVSGLCTLLGWLKSAVAVTAIIAGVIMVMNSQFGGKSAFIGELCTNIILGCVVVGVLGYLVQATGLSPACS